MGPLGGSWARRVAATVVSCALAAAAAAGPAHAGWDAPEPIAPATNTFRIGLAPGGPGYVTGFPLTGPDRFRYAVRPLGGALGPAFEMPGTSGTNFDGFWRFDAAGNAVIANTYQGKLGHLPAGGVGGSSQDLPAGYYPDAVSVAPTGEALIVAAPSLGIIRVALRPAGPNQTADFSPTGAQLFGDTSTAGVIGALLQADGGAIVVWQQNDGTLHQSVRRSGEPSFDPPTAIADPRADTRKFSVRFDGDASGNAMLAWLGSSGGTARDQAVAAVRGHDGSFGPAQVVGTGGSVVNVTPAVTASGDGMVAWSHQFAGAGCTASTIMGSALHAGTFAAQQPLGPSELPLTSSQGYPETVISEGDRLAVPVLEIDHGLTPCSFGDDRRGLFYRHFHSGPSGLVDDGRSELSPLQSRAGGVTSYPSISEQTLEPGGRMLVSYQVDAARYLRSFDGVPPGGGGPAPPAPEPPAGSSPAPPVSPASPPASAIVPIRPKLYVDVAALNPSKLEVSIVCSADQVAAEDCGSKAFVYWLFIGQHQGKKSSAHGAATRPKAKRILVAAGAARIPKGKRGKLRLKLTKAGRQLVARRKPVKVLLVVTITRGARSGTDEFRTTLKAKARKRPGRGR